MHTQQLHEILKRIGSVLCVRIKSGPLKGAKWILSTGKHFIAGTYEPEKTRGIARTIQRDMVAVDIGAHVGYYSLIMSRGVGPRGVVHSFEPRNLNRQFLRKHVAINGIKNVTIHSQCVGDRNGPVQFETRTGTGTGHVSESGNVAVEMITLDSAIAGDQIPTPDVIKIDVEGSEVLVLKGAAKILNNRKPILILAVHSLELETKCRRLLEPLGYRFEDLGQSKGDKEFLVTVP